MISTTLDVATRQYRAVDDRYPMRVVYADTADIAADICRDFEDEMRAIFGMEM